MIPIIRPVIAPIDIDGIIKPDGTLTPIVNVTSATCTIRAKNNCQIARWTPGPANPTDPFDLPFSNWALG